MIINITAQADRKQSKMSWLPESFFSDLYFWIVLLENVNIHAKISSASFKQEKNPYKKIAASKSYLMDRKCQGLSFLLYEPDSKREVSFAFCSVFLFYLSYFLRLYILPSAFKLRSFLLGHSGIFHYHRCVS